MDLKAGIVTNFEPVLILKVKLFVSINLVDSVKLPVELERDWLLIGQIHISIVHTVRLAHA